jgi:hypothetical protein
MQLFMRSLATVTRNHAFAALSVSLFVPYSAALIQRNTGKIYNQGRCRITNLLEFDVGKLH